MNKFLIIYAHPNPASLNHAVLENCVAQLKAAGKTVTVRDLYALHFDPVLKAEDFVALKSGTPSADVVVEQDLVRSHDVLIFIGPIWWLSLPAIMKGWIDRVFTFGFAYAVGPTGLQKLLTGKKAFIINTTGQTKEVYTANNMLIPITGAWDLGTFGFTGIEVVEHVFLHGVMGSTPESRAAMLEDVKAKIASKLLA
ncbi:flavodoxin family protein [Pelomyxa schiedti]|nr:flavodoxin family protein [Pelomyxa schiedti]